MIKIINCCVFFCCAFFLKAQQNLILNPSVENHESIPSGLAQYNYCQNWWEPYIWSTDYYTSLTNSNNQNFIPLNINGYQESNDGKFYLGIDLVIWNYNLNDFSNFRLEYASGQFLHDLEKDKIYRFDFWMSKAEQGVLKSNAIDLFLTYDTILDINSYESYGYKIWSEKVPFEDTINWIKISTCFQAKGSEKAFSIGNFHEKSEIVKILTENPTSSVGEFDYRYLDNFSLIECPSCCPDQFVDEPLVYVFSNPSTFGNPASLELWLHPNSTGILELYDGAGRIVAKENYSNLQNTFSLERFAKGMYHFVYQTSDGVTESGKILIAE